MRFALPTAILTLAVALPAAAQEAGEAACPFFATPGSWSPGQPAPTEPLAEYYVEGLVLTWDAAAGNYTSPRPFRHMDVVDFNADPSRRAVSVEYQAVELLGCTGKLRQYVFEGVNDGTTGPLRPVAPQLEFRPGDTLALSITNNLPAPDDAQAPHGAHLQRIHPSGEEFEDVHGHHGVPAASSEFGFIAPPDPGPSDAAAGNDPIYNMIHGLNNTNIHTHGWNVSPRGASDNVFVTIQPGDPAYDQTVRLDAPGEVNDTGHPSGTFWYHAHKHGATAVQVSSGMAGTLVVRDDAVGLDRALAEIDDSIVEKTLMLQQLPYDARGMVEGIAFLQENVRQTGANCGEGAAYANRPPFVNGVPTPLLEIELNQVYRFRFLHSGSIGGITPQVVASPELEMSPGLRAGATRTDITLPLYEIATDGLPTGTIVPMENIPLSAAYRSDALFQVTMDGLTRVRGNLDAAPPMDGGHTYLYLVDAAQQPTVQVPSCETPNADIQNARRILAVLKVAVDATDAPADGLVLARDYTEARMTGPLAQALADYQSQGWQATNLGNDNGYRMISALPEIGTEELRASAPRYCRHDDGSWTAGTPNISACEPTAVHDGTTTPFEDVAVETVHYFGDGRNSFRCPLTGGRCTYCGGAVSEYRGTDGNIYNATTRFADGARPGICDEPRPTTHPVGPLPRLDFMICDRVVDTDAPLDAKSKVWNADGVQMCTDPGGATQACSCTTRGDTTTCTPIDGSSAELSPATPRDITLMAGASPKQWSCFLFDTEDDYIRNVELYSANEWAVSSAGNAGHVFHIHVNPFTRERPAGTDFFGATFAAYDVWKDTFRAPSTRTRMRFQPEDETRLRTRYSYHSGAFVQHCHVLTHEDQGMMQVVSVSDPEPFDRLMALRGFETRAEARAFLSGALYADGPLSAMQVDSVTLEDFIE
jgi:FtsP/CotA-like multicopper oxidase with cupredoxin domain